MLNVDLNSYGKQVRARLLSMKTDLNDKATVRALNKTGAQVKTAASREIRAAGYNMKAGDIKKQIKVIPATAGKPVVTVRCVGRPVPLIKFSARQTGKGVTVNVKNGRKLIRGAFVATMPSGHRGVFIRTGHDHRRVVRGGKVVWSGLPIKQLFGPAIPDAFGNQVVSGALVSLARAKFPNILAHEIEFLRSR